MELDESIDRVAEVISQGRINMRVLASTDPAEYVACREIVAQLWPALERLVKAVNAALKPFAEMSDAE